MQVISLFSGIGGFELAAEWMGWQPVVSCEINPFGQKVLKHHWPEAYHHDNIHTLTKELILEKSNWKESEPTILVGGFPCQPFSNAGNRGGMDDNRYLWPEMRRVIRETQPGIIVAENVAGLFTILEPASLSEVESKEIQLFSENEDYQINSTIERLQRRIIATIIEEIRSEGYVLPCLADGTPIVCCIPACAVNAPHRRDRVWFIAYNNKRTTGSPGKGGSIESNRSNNHDEQEQWGEQAEQHNRPFELLRPAINPNNKGGTAGFGEIQKEDGEIPEWNNDAEFGNAGAGIASNTAGNRRERNGQGIEIEKGLQPGPEPAGQLAGGFEGLCNSGDVANPANIGHEPSGTSWAGRAGFENGNSGVDTDTVNTGLQGGELNGTFDQEGQEGWEQPSRSATQLHQITDWTDFPTVRPICGKYDGFFTNMVRYITPNLYATISERYTDKDLQEVQNAFQSQEIQRQIGRLYKIHESGILLKVLQLCSPTNTEPKGFSAWSEKASEKILRKLQQYGTIANTPQGRELEKQFTGQFADTLPYLSHEIALVAMEAERATVAFTAWHRNESIKAYGNAIVPHVAFQIFKAIQQMQDQL